MPAAAGTAVQVLVLLQVTATHACGQKPIPVQSSTSRHRHTKTLFIVAGRCVDRQRELLLQCLLGGLSDACQMALADADKIDLRCSWCWVCADTSKRPKWSPTSLAEAYVPVGTRPSGDLGLPPVFTFNRHHKGPAGLLLASGPK